MKARIRGGRSGSMTYGSRLLVAAALLASACSSNPRGVPVAPAGESPTVVAGDRLACSFFWRQSDAHPHTATKHVELAPGNTSFRLEDFDVVLAVEPNEAGGRALAIETVAGAATIRSSYDFGSASAPTHLPAGGHGFTGLRYLTQRSGSEMQYFCGAYGDGVDVQHEMASQSVPGAGVPEDALSCAFVTFHGDGSELGRVHLVLEPGATKKVFDLSGFAISVQRMEAGPESGGLVIEAGEPSDAALLPIVHSLYQLSEPGLPANTMSDESFTGVQSLDRDGRRLEYRCWSGSTVDALGGADL